jgi:AraC-like DNA-binding protein
LEHEVRRYPVRHPLLKNYIKFFWEIHIENTQIDHKLIPQRNINLRFNLSDTPHYLHKNGSDLLLENVFFSGLQDHFPDASIKLSGDVHLLGVCFKPDGFFPFSGIPVCEFKNQLIGAEDAGFRLSNPMINKLREAPDTFSRLEILESELLVRCVHTEPVPEKFRQVFRILENPENSSLLSDFCQQNHIDMRQLERLYNKYVGISAKAFFTLNRFHKSLNQLLHSEYNKFSDLAFDNDYFDQMHFIRDFKRFAGNTPKKFVKQGNSILQIGKLKDP